MSRTKQSDLHLRYDYDELDRFDTLLKNASTGLQFVQQGLDALREVVGTGVLYTDMSPRGAAPGRSGSPASRPC